MQPNLIAALNAFGINKVFGKKRVNKKKKKIHTGYLATKYVFTRQYCVCANLKRLWCKNMRALAHRQVASSLSSSFKNCWTKHERSPPHYIQDFSNRSWTRCCRSEWGRVSRRGAADSPEGTAHCTPDTPSSATPHDARNCAAQSVEGKWLHTEDSAYEHLSWNTHKHTRRVSSSLLTALPHSVSATWP